MIPDDLRKFSGLANMQLDLAQKELGKISNQESEVRGALARLDQQFAETALTNPENLHRMQKLGAQELWAGWMRRRRAQLNQELALILARKSHQLGIVRGHLGKRDALDALAKHHEHIEKVAQGRRSEVAIGDHAVMLAGHARRDL